MLQEIAEYFSRNYDYGTDLKLTIQKVQAFDVPMPGDVDANASDTEKLIWNKRVTEYVRRTAKLQSNMQKAFPLIYGQCTEFLRAKLEVL